MPFLHFCLVFAGTVLLHVRSIQGQLLESEIPDVIKHLFKGDLDKWEPSTELLKIFPLYLSGYDYENRPVWVMEFGKWDVREYIQRGENEELIFEKYLDRFIYSLVKSIGDRATSDDPVKEAIMIYDMNGYNLRQLTSPRVIACIVRALRRLLAGATFMSEIHMVNCNAMAEYFLNLIRPVLGRYGEKMVAYGTNKEKWIPLLLKKIPMEALPEGLGGAKGFVPVKVYG